jgi:hypothetical protein
MKQNHKNNYVFVFSNRNSNYGGNRIVVYSDCIIIGARNKFFAWLKFLFCHFSDVAAIEEIQGVYQVSFSGRLTKELNSAEVIEQTCRTYNPCQKTVVATEHADGYFRMEIDEDGYMSPLEGCTKYEYETAALKHRCVYCQCQKCRHSDNSAAVLKLCFKCPHLECRLCGIPADDITKPLTHEGV